MGLGSLHYNRHPRLCIILKLRAAGCMGRAGAFVEWKFEEPLELMADTRNATEIQTESK